MLAQRQARVTNVVAWPCLHKVYHNPHLLGRNHYSRCCCCAVRPTYIHTLNLQLRQSNKSELLRTTANRYYWSHKLCLSKKNKGVAIGQHLKPILPSGGICTGLSRTVPEDGRRLADGSLTGARRHCG